MGFWEKILATTKPKPHPPAKVLGLLKRMIAEEPALSFDRWVDPRKLHELLVISQRHEEIIRGMGTTLIPGLCHTLNHADPKIRKKSCWALLILGEVSGLPDETILTIAKLIWDSEQEVREQALCSLRVLASTINLAVAVQQLVAALKSADPGVRKAAAEVLGNMGARAAPALESLHSMLLDADVDAAEAAKAAIIKLGGKVGAPAPGSLGEVEQLARLTTSQKYGVPEKAWEDLKKLTNPEAAIEPLMKIFRSPAGKKALRGELPEFLSDLGTEACRAPLMEILDYARGSSDPWDRESLVEGSCFALLSLKGGASALRPAVPSELLQFILMQGFMSYYGGSLGRLRTIVETLTVDERRRIIADIISFFRSARDKDECSYKVSCALGLLGTDAIEPLLEVFRSVKPSKLQPDGSVHKDEKGEDGASASALVKIPGAIEKLRVLCSAEEYKKILVIARSYSGGSNPALDKALDEITLLKGLTKPTERNDPQKNGKTTAMFSPSGQAVRGRTAVSKNLIGHIDLSSWIPASLLVSPDSRRFAYVAHKGQKWFAVIDGEESDPWDGIVKDSLVFSPDGSRVAYAALEGNKNFVVVDGRTEGKYDDVMERGISEKGRIVFSADGKRLAYAARIDSLNEHFVVIDGKKGKPYFAIAPNPVFSPDNENVAYWASFGPKWLLVLNGKETMYDSFTQDALLFSPNSKRLAYAPRLGSKWFVVVDNEQGKQYDGIGWGSLRFSPDSRRLAYSAKLNERVLVVIDGKEERRYDSIAQGEPIFSPNSKRVAYGVRVGNKQFVVVDGKEGKPYDGIGNASLIFSPDSQHVAYSAKVGDKWCLVVNGKEGKLYDEMGTGENSVIFSPDSQRTAYATKKGNDWYVVVDGKESNRYGGHGKGTLVFSPDSRHVAYVAGEPRNQFVVVDGGEGSPYDGILSGSKPIFDTDNSLHYIAGRVPSIYLVEERI